MLYSNIMEHSSSAVGRGGMEVQQTTACGTGMRGRKCVRGQCNEMCGKTPCCPLQPAGELLGLAARKGNGVHGAEKGVVIDLVACREEVVDLTGGLRALQLLAVQELLLELVEGL